MIKEKNNEHSIDVFFVLCIFLLFSVFISLVLGFGMKTYEAISAEAQDNYELRTSLLYVSNKLRAYDEEGGIYTEDFQGNDALVLKENIDGENYVTRLYAYDGSLMELFTEESNVLEPIAGTAITKVTDFSVENIKDNIIKVTVQSPDGNESSIVATVH